jgi:hypothetical protein
MHNEKVTADTFVGHVELLCWSQMKELIVETFT